MKSLSYRGRVALFLIALASVSLTGCQGLLGHSSNKIGVLSVSNASLGFGGTPVGKSATLSEVLTNTGGSPTTISQASVSGAHFSLKGPALPTTIAPDQSVTFTVTFTPTAPGAATGTLVAVASDAADPTSNIPLSGSGLAQGTLSPSPSALAFGNVQVGSGANLVETLSNTGGSSVTISAASVTGSGMTLSGLTLPLTLSAGQSSSFTVKFAPTAAGTSNGNIVLTSNASSSSLNIPLSGTGVSQGTLSPSPSTLAFGNVQVGNSASLVETLSNTGGSSVTISAASASGSGMSLSGLTLPLTLNAGQSTTFNVRFAPAAAGAVSGNIAVTSDASSSSLNIPSSGTGVALGALSPSPSTLVFGNVQVGNSASLVETLSNTGGSSVTITQANLTGAAFSITGLTLPLTLTAGQSASFTAKFTPGAAGAVSGSIAITSNASNPSLNVPLSGTGLTVGSLGPNPSSLAFGNVRVGSSANLAETLSNTGGSAVTISAASVTGSGMSLSGLTLPLTLNAGQSTSFTVKFAPTTPGALSGGVAITSNASNPSLDIPVSGTGAALGALSPNPSSLAFGNVQVGSSANLAETLSNTGGSAVTISAASASGSGMSLNGLTLPLTLSAGQSTSFNVRFAPAAAGAVSGNIAVTSDASNPSLNIPLSATGVALGALSPSPSSLAFGNVQVGNSASLVETLSNTGGSSVTISAASASGSGMSLSGLTLPFTLNAGQSTTFNVRFAPAAAGAVSGNIAVTSDASSSSLNIPSSGTGVALGALSPSPSTLVFGNVQVGNSASLVETLSNTGGSSVTISAASASGSGMSLNGLTLPLTLSAGQSTSFNVRFAPAAAGAVSGNIAVTSDASNPSLNIPLSATGVALGALSPSPSSLAFGNVQVGNSASLVETLSNTGGSSVTITQANLTGAAFSIAGLTLPTTLLPGHNLSFTATFTPAASGATSGTLSIVSDASNSPLSVPLSGTGTAAGQLSVSPSTLDFGSVLVGNNSALGGLLTATGASVTVSSGSSNSSEFALSGITLPNTIAAGQSVPFTVTFTPSASGIATAALTFASNASNSPAVQSLTGTGTLPPPHSVDLTWNASSGAASYNIYRKFATASNYTQISSGVASTNYTDNSVTAGQAYDYAATAVDASNVESTYSNIAAAIIPTP